MCNGCPKQAQEETIKALKAGAGQYAERTGSTTVYIIHRTVNDSYGYSPDRPTNDTIQIIDTLFFNS